MSLLCGRYREYVKNQLLGPIGTGARDQDGGSIIVCHHSMGESWRDRVEYGYTVSNFTWCKRMRRTVLQESEQALNGGTGIMESLRGRRSYGFIGDRLSECMGGILL